MSEFAELDTLFERTLADLKLNLNLTDTVFDMWLKPLKPISYREKTFLIGAPSAFAMSVARDNYGEDIKDQLSRYVGITVNVEWTVLEAEDGGEESPSVQPASNPEDYRFEYTFDNFIVGTTNKFAYAACTAVAAHPASNYNPLFIYGPSGLGKTHLMNAIVGEICKKTKGLTVVYKKGEDFTNEMIDCLARKDMQAFREKYRKCDILLIDDIQFIAGKVSTQEEFFHTFNALYECHKQIILASDRPPREINTLEDRLKTRFEGGLLADIQPPDLELRIAIIKKKAEQIGVDLSPEVLRFLAENLRSNIRQIEGAIRKLSAITFLTGEEITLATANDCLTELLGGAEPVHVTVDKLFEQVEKHFGVSKEDIVGNKRNKEITDARKVFIYLVRKVTEMSYPSIAKTVDKDPSSVQTSYKAIVKHIAQDALFAEMIEGLVNEWN